MMQLLQRNKDSIIIYNFSYALGICLDSFFMFLAHIYNLDI